MMLFFQDQFICLWRTLYDMFTDTSEEQQLYHSIATVGRLLLQIGDVGKRFRLSSSQSGVDAVLTPDSESNPVDNPELPSPSVNSGEESFAESDSLKVEGAACPGGAAGDSTLHDNKPDQGQDDLDKKSEGNETRGTPEKTLNKALDKSEESLVTNVELSPSSPKNTSKPDKDWSISFEQLLASLLTEAPLVDFFERIYDTTDAVAALRNRRLVTRHSSSPSNENKEKS